MFTKTFLSILTISIITLLGNTVLAANYVCNISEKVKEQDFENQYVLTLDANGSGEMNLDKTAGGLTNFSLRVSNNRAFVSLTDPKTKTEINTSFDANPGTTAQVQHLFDTNTSDYLVISCNHTDARVELPKPSQFACTMTETANANENATEFILPVATHGHDVTNLPPSQIPNFTGWVLAYNGLMLFYFQNAEDFAGLTTLGSWDAYLELSWYPNNNETKVALRCEPKH